MSDDETEADIVLQLDALATYAESANHWTDDKRLMDAAGVADTIYGAIERIEELEAKLAKAVARAEVAEAATGNREMEYQNYINETTPNGFTRLDNIIASVTPCSAKVERHVATQIDMAFQAGWSAAIRALAAERDALLKAQSYTYIGKDGKSVLARDLEDQRDALQANLAELLAVAKRAVRLSLAHSDFKLHAMEPMHQAIAAAELKRQDR